MVQAGRFVLRTGRMDIFRDEVPERTKRAFWKKVAAPNKEGCRLWTGGLDKQGYGVISWLGNRATAHRFAYALEHGRTPVLPGQVNHHCDVKTCVNATHLYDGTQEQNMDDALVRGLIRSGQKHGMSKLTDQQVKEIRARYAQGGHSYRSLAKEYDIDFGWVGRIVRGEFRGGG